MTAAMGVVTSDAEEQMLDPRTLAMLKYKDALAAMQAADQMMAASQPAPTPPTVAERTKLAAEQGIMGLASKLSPGIQQQGGQMQAEQMQQAMSGGLPQLSAPNMAGMAGGGIVAFQTGGQVLTPEEIAAAQEALAAMPASTPRPPPPTREEIAAARETLGIFGLIGGTERAAQRATAQEEEKNRASRIQALIDMGLPTSAARRIVDEERQQTPEAATNQFDTELDLTRPEPAPAPAPAPAPEQPSGLPALAGQMITQGNAPVDRIASDVSGEDELAALRESTNVIRDRALDPDFVESSRIDVEGRAKEAYGIPEDLKELYRSRIEALDKPMYTPEEERSRKLSALLSGLASSNLIAQGGPAASRAIAKVSDDIREDSVARAEKQFDLASGLIGMDMQASQQAFGAGLEATITSMSQQGVALQMAISQLNAADNREAAALLQESQNGIEMTKQMIESFKNGQANARDVQRNVGLRLRDLGTQINQLQNLGTPNQPLDPEITTAITVLENEQAMLQAVFKATLEESGFAVPESTEYGGEGDISDAELLRRLGN
jgi:hypothetical protein